MCSLQQFRSPPPPGFVTLCEQNSELTAARIDEPEFTKQKLNLDYPDVNLCQDLSKHFLSRESARSAFIQQDDTLWKRIYNAWHEHGVVGVLEELTAIKTTSSAGWHWIKKSSSSLLAVVRLSKSLHGSLFPHLSMASEAMIAEFSSNLNWSESVIRDLAWHPHAAKFAVALRDDSIKVYTTRKADIIPTLKHKLQKGIAMLAWKPMSVSVLAVACQTCVLLWHVDPQSLATRPSTSSVQVLLHSSHAPVTSLAWCPQGGALATSSPADSSVLVWDTARETCVALRRIGGGGVSLLKWSPDGSKLLAASPSSVFRVWETQTWTCERWSHLSGRCQTACWSKDGTVLLFATADEPIIYSLMFSHVTSASQPAAGGSKTAVAGVDLSEVIYDSPDGKISVGGLVQTMVWDPSGERLAVLFKRNCSIIALFRTRLSPVFEIMPCGFVQGETGCVAHTLSFQKNFGSGALLSVVWSNGKVTFLPLYFLSSESVQRNSSQNPLGVADRLLSYQHTHQSYTEHSFLHS